MSVTSTKLTIIDFGADECGKLCFGEQVVAISIVLLELGGNAGGRMWTVLLVRCECGYEEQV